MNVRAGDLLRQLGSGVRPDGATPAQGRAPLTSASFADLLGQVRSGVVSSGRPVEVARGADIELNADQLARLARVTDTAEAAGASRLLAMIDGQLLTVDVPARTVDGGPGDAGDVLTDIDAFVAVPPADGDAGALFGGAEQASSGPGAMLPGLGGLRNASLGGLLEGLTGAGESETD